MKEYEILLVCTRDNGYLRGRALVHEVALPPLLDGTEEVLGVYCRRIFTEEELCGRRIEDMPIFASAQERAEERVRQLPFKPRPIAILEVLP